MTLRSGLGLREPGRPVLLLLDQAIDWPASDPLVTAVGGTQLHLDAKGNRTAPDSVWDDLSSTVGVTGPVYTWGSSGGGHSTVFRRPEFQDTGWRASSATAGVRLTSR